MRPSDWRHILVQEDIMGHTNKTTIQHSRTLKRNVGILSVIRYLHSGQEIQSGCNVWSSRTWSNSWAKKIFIHSIHLVKRAFRMWWWRWSGQLFETRTITRRERSDWPWHARWNHTAIPYFWHLRKKTFYGTIVTFETFWRLHHILRIWTVSLHQLQHMLHRHRLFEGPRSRTPMYLHNEKRQFLKQGR